MDHLINAYKDNDVIVDEIKGILFAGHETTGHTISFCIYELLKNPDIMKEVIEEIDEVLENGKIEDMNQVGRLVKLESCIKETLRLYPPAGLTVLTTTKTTQFGEYLIPKNTAIFGLTIALLQNPDYWHHSDKFYPQRFWDKNFVEKELPENNKCKKDTI